MSANGRLLSTFARSLKNGELDGEAIATRLYSALDAERQEAGITDIWWYGLSVEMELANGEHWAIECLGPDAFHLYPGMVWKESVTWVNVWVAPDYTLEEMIEQLNGVIASAIRKKSNA